ncbi:MAG TPA: hypothetical protein ENK44_17160 [Caldithrix abyssi]|uniref:PTS sugar transporter subunit IIC n=1 Tax=Caldithrix abyssi TaxID=187145 RepID=A0A7V4WWQ7_CALAY|nr:hypothetical protein [Caldithrix abyssi]
MDILWLSLAGAALMMDTTATFQIMVSQPIVACTIIGYLGGDAAMGLHIGLLLQLLWLSDLPVGATLVPAGNYASIVSAAVAVELIGIFPEKHFMIVLLIVLYSLLLSYFGARMVRINRNWNTYFFNKAVRYMEKGSVGAITFINYQALLMHFIIAFLLVFSGILLGEFLIGFITRELSVTWNETARFIEVALLGTGAGLTLSLYKRNEMKTWIVGGAIVALLYFLFQ